jgi:glutamyl/glutaminyl-tRNA synthetase
MKDSHNKLSKRNGDASFQDLIKRGYLAPAIINYLALLGWSPETTQEIYSLEELIKIFNVNRISKSPAIFDIEKLKWVNNHYIKELSIDELCNLTFPYLQKSYDLADKSEEWLKELVSIYQNQLSYGEEIVDLAELFFKKNIIIDEETKDFMKDESIPKTIEIFKKEIEQISDWTVDNITNAINNIKEKANVKGKMLYMPIRIKITGEMHGPELPNTIHLIGKDMVLERLN